jgi:2-polyprenyl-6-methoxyphenol hydroxylase-like FAD-dependent oxidoreductase
MPASSRKCRYVGRVTGYDAAIVGASIAGCTTATFLARQGAKVALIESHSDPQAFKRMCTHFIQASASPTIDRLGITAALRGAHARHTDTNIWTRYGWISFGREAAGPPLSEWAPWNIRREKLDPILRDLAASTDGVDLLLGHTVNGLLRDGERVTGVKVRERDGAEHEFRAKLVVAADGRDSEIAKLAGAPTKLKPHNRFGYMAYYRDTPLVTGDSAQMWLLDPDVAYAFPTDSDLVCLAAFPSKDKLAEFKPDPGQALARLFASLPDAPELDPAKSVSKPLGKLEMPNVIRRPVQPGLALVGDAALAADPLWGVGCGWAFQSAEWLSESVGPSLSGDAEEVDAGLERYRQRHRAGLAAHEKFTSEYSTARRFNPMEKLLFRAAARDQVLAQRMALMGERWISPQKMLTPGLIARMIRVNLTPRSAPLGLRGTASAAN